MARDLRPHFSLFFLSNPQLSSAHLDCSIRTSGDTGPRYSKDQGSKKRPCSLLCPAAAQTTYLPTTPWLTQSQENGTTRNHTASPAQELSGDCLGRASRCPCASLSTGLQRAAAADSVRRPTSLQRQLKASSNRRRVSGTWHFFSSGK